MPKLDAAKGTVAVQTVTVLAAVTGAQLGRLLSQRVLNRASGVLFTVIGGVLLGLTLHG